MPHITIRETELKQCLEGNLAQEILMLENKKRSQIKHIKRKANRRKYKKQKSMESRVENFILWNTELVNRCTACLKRIQYCMSTILSFSKNGKTMDKTSKSKLEKEIHETEKLVDQGSANLFYKGQRANILGFSGHISSLSQPLLVFSLLSFFPLNFNNGSRADLACRLSFANHCCRHIDQGKKKREREKTQNL